MHRERERPYHHGSLRELLLVEAEARLERSGPEGISLRELGRTLGVSHSAAQRHFADKRALLDALAESGFRRLGANLAESIGTGESGFDGRLRRLARAHLGFGLRHPSLLRWMFDASGRLDAPPSLARAREAALAPASLVFGDGQARGEVVAGDPEELGWVGFAAVQGLIALTAGTGLTASSAAAIVDGMIDRLILGLRHRG